MLFQGGERSFQGPVRRGPSQAANTVVHMIIDENKKTGFPVINVDSTSFEIHAAVWPTLRTTTMILVLVLSLFLSSTHASPSSPAQVILGNVALYPKSAKIEQNWYQYLDDAQKLIIAGKEDQNMWYHDGRQYIKQNELLYELVSHPSFDEHQLRITEPTLCDLDVQQYSGYLDITSSKHLFFWFFEARESPESAPLILWLNGGPGCSSSAGLLFELGPCNIANDGRNTTYNPYSWNKHANIVFLDQPVEVGFSYDDEYRPPVNNSVTAGQDVYAFLQLFFSRFPQYSGLPFHLAAESYGGTYAPNFAKIIHRRNKQLPFAPLGSPLKHINLASVVLANGLTSPKIQFGSTADYACNGPYPIFSDPEGPECSALRDKTTICQRLIENCYRFSNRFPCAEAFSYCYENLWDIINKLGLNPYDVRKECETESGDDICYKQIKWIDTWLNEHENKIALGANPSRTFKSCNKDVNEAFTSGGEEMHNHALLLPELIDDGVRLLVYAGNADGFCNFIGEERWVEELDTRFKAEFSAAKSLAWFEPSGRQAGLARSAGKGAGNVTFVEIYEAGHMAPYDQPAAALDLITRWMRNEPLDSGI